MASGITLKKGRLSKALRDSLDDYYKSIGADADYTNNKWRQWTDNPGIIKYRAEREAVTVGWIIYNPEKSTIDEILVSEKQQGNNIEPRMIDALILRETLVTAEIMKRDKKKYQWMVEYGFRPTRSFFVDGLSFFRMDLSTSVLFKKLEGQKPARMYRKIERVAIEQITETRTDIAIKAALKGLLDKLGGLNRFVRPGQSVAIKPNDPQAASHRFFLILFVH